MQNAVKHSCPWDDPAVRRRHLITSTRTRLSEGNTLTGVFVISSDPRLVELWALGGFDFVVVDLEHSTLDLQDADRLIVHALAAGLTPLVRVARGDERLAQRALDAGAAGIVAAGVECRKDLDMWWSAIMYPPAGQRGVAQV